ncbi:endonuclease [Chitinophaga ginsengisegetis]|uniref:DNA-formamidopyrimidine glycosylase family protein n=1 Tax=Chitinophaga ginsengisegetis TaxID=393003 RepID=UPI00342C6098
MPEGPSIVILKEEAARFTGKKVITASGNSKTIDFNRMTGKKILAFKSWGKHFLICFPGFTVRIHFLMFGTYRINETKDMPARLHLQFASGELNFYTSSIRIIDEPLDEVYDWSADVLNENWDASKAMAKLKKIPDALVCDALLNQDIFAGVGNIIKNEVLFRIRVHPQSLVGKLPLKKKKELVREAVQYSYDFLAWKKAFVLKKHWLAHTKTICPRCEIPLIKAYLGKTNRRSFFCNNCQIHYE